MKITKVSDKLNSSKQIPILLPLPKSHTDCPKRYNLMTCKRRRASAQKIAGKLSEVMKTFSLYCYCLGDYYVLFANCIKVNVDSFCENLCQEV